MKKGNRHSKQIIDASNSDDFEKRIHQLELENKAYQVALLFFLISFFFEVWKPVWMLRKF